MNERNKIKQTVEGHECNIRDETVGEGSRKVCIRVFDMGKRREKFELRDCGADV
jgi:hypothetical protein